MLAGLPRISDPKLMVGFDSSDDAAVYRIDDDTALIQTVDFFPPIVDDPFQFGQVAATNALSDVWAMGGTPKIAMNLLTFPSCLSLDVVKAILAGGYDKVMEAGAVIVGGHSIEDQEPKYGLCVSGFARPEDILTNSGAQEGDVLVLTKPLGTGILSTGAKAGLLSQSEYDEMLTLMTTLNQKGQQAMLPVRPTACTDITGFGLLGHVQEMAKGSGKTVELWADAIPIVPKALELARDGIIPGGAYRNRGYLQDDVAVDGAVPLEVSDVLFDPQTAGGLLITVPQERGQELLCRLHDLGVPGALIGQVLPLEDKLVRVRPMG